MTTPIEQNARKLIEVFVQYFPGGATCEDQRRQFEKDTGLKRQSFYNALAYSKKRGWIIGGGSPHNQNQLYHLNPDCSWKEPVASIGEALEKDRLEYLVNSQTQQFGKLRDEVERLRDWSGSDDANGGAGVALSSLVRIVGDSGASTRQRIKAASAVLGYKVSDEGVVEFTKKFLQSICTSIDIAIDYKIEAGELLRRHEDAKIVPATERPPARTDNVGEPPIPLLELVRQRRERADRMEREMLREMELSASHMLPGDDSPTRHACDMENKDPQDQ